MHVCVRVHVHMRVRVRVRVRACVFVCVCVRGVIAQVVLRASYFFTCRYVACVCARKNDRFVDIRLRNCPQIGIVLR